MLPQFNIHLSAFIRPFSLQVVLEKLVKEVSGIQEQLPGLRSKKVDLLQEHASLKQERQLLADDLAQVMMLWGGKPVNIFHMSPRKGLPAALVKQNPK
jgi:hypothetical protein